MTGRDIALPAWRLGSDLGFPSRLEFRFSQSPPCLIHEESYYLFLITCIWVVFQRDSQGTWVVFQRDFGGVYGWCFSVENFTESL